MTSIWKWSHDILLLFSMGITLTSIYRLNPNKIYIRKWEFLHGSLFYTAWLVESFYLFCNNKNRRIKINNKFMKYLYKLTIICCIHNIIHLLGHCIFIFDDNWIGWIICIGFLSQWSFWSYKIFSRGIR